MNNELKIMLQAVVQEALQPIRDEIVEMKANMATKADIQEIKSELADIKETVSVIVNDQKNDVVKLLTKVDENILEVKSRVRNMENVQDRQHHVIDLLSARSIQHEAELRRKQ